MADTKISALSALTGANLASGDKIPVVDVSDTTMAASGTDKAMTAAETAIGLAPLLTGLAGGTAKVVRKTSDETVTSSTTLQDDDALTFAVAANEVWVGRIVVFYDAVTAADISLSVDVPAGATLAFSVAGPATTATAAEDIARFRMRNTAGAFGLGGLGAGTLAVGTIEFYVANSSTAGNIKLQWAQSVSNATGTIVKAGSHIVAHRFA